MLCKNCEKEIDNESIFCQYCGTKIIDERNTILSKDGKNCEYNNADAEMIEDKQDPGIKQDISETEPKPRYTINVFDVYRRCYIFF